MLKGLTGKISLIFLITFIVAFSLFLILGYSAPNYEIPANNNYTNFSNGTKYSLTNVYMFEVNITNTTVEGENITWTLGTNFTLGRPDGTVTTYNFSTTSGLVNNSTTLPIRLRINFTQNQLGPAGTYNYSFGLNTTSSLNLTSTWTNTTPTTIFTIAKGDLPIILYFNGSTVGHQTSSYPNSTIDVAAYVEGLRFEIWKNDTLLLNATSGENITNWGIGNHNFTVYSAGDENYSSNSTMRWWNISIGNPNSYIKLYLDNVTSDKTITYPSNGEIRGNISVNATGSTDVIFTLYRNDTTLGVGNYSNETTNNAQLTPGIYSFVYNTSGGTNWSSGSVTRTLTVIQGIPTLVLNVSPTNSTTYPTTPTATAYITSGGDTGANISLYRNGSLVNSSTSLTIIFEAILLGAGAYNYTVVYNGTQNYSSTNLTNITVISKGTSDVKTFVLENSNAYGQNITRSYYGNNLGAKGNSTSTTNPPTFNLYMFNVTQSSPAISLSNISANPATIPTFNPGAGTYQIVYNTSGNENWTAAENNSVFLIVNKVDISTLDGVYVNITYNGTGTSRTYPNITNVTAWLYWFYPSQSDLTFNLYRNNVNISSVSSYPYIVNDSVTLLGTGNYTFILNNSEGGNFSSGSITRILNITKGTPNVKTYQTVSNEFTETAGNITREMGNYNNYWTAKGNSSTIITPPDFTLYVFNVTQSSPAVSLSNTSTSSVTTNILATGAGTYQIVYNTSGNSNWTSAENNSLFFINNKANITSLGTTYANININGTNSDSEKLYSNITYVAASIYQSFPTSSDMTFNLYRNNGTATSLIGSSSTHPWEINDTTTLGVGNYTYIYNTTGGENFTAGSVSRLLNITKGVVTPYLNVYIDGNASNKTITYPAIANISANETMSGDSDCTYTLWRNTTILANGSAVWNYTWLSNSSNYTIKYNVSGTCANWTLGESSTYYLFVNKATPTLNLLIDGAASDKTVTYGTSTNTTAYEDNTGDGGITYTLYRTLSSTTSSIGTSNPISDVATLAEGTYYYLYNNTANENYSTTSATKTLAVSSATLTPSSSGGGGGGTVTPTTKVLSVKGNANVTIPSIAAGKSSNVTIVKTEDVDFRQVNITVANAVNNIKITITKIAEAPASVTHEISGKVYHYIQIDKTNFTDSDVSKVFLKVAVNKSWFTNNGVDKNNVSLYRWTNNRWNELDTSYVSEDSYEVYYKAESPGFSYFLIGTKGGEAPEAPTGEEITCTESWSCTSWSACTGGTKTRTCTDANACGTTVGKPAESESCVVQQQVKPEDKPWMLYSVAAVVVIAIASILFIFRKKTMPILLKITSKMPKRKRSFAPKKQLEIITEEEPKVE